MRNGKTMAIVYAIVVFVVFVIVDVAYLSFASNNIKRKYADLTDSEKIKEDNEKAKFDPDDDVDPTEESTSGSTDDIEITEIEPTEDSTSSSSSEESTSDSTDSSTSQVPTSSSTTDEPLVSVISGTSSTTTVSKSSTSTTGTTPTTKKTTTSKKTSSGGGTTKKTSSTTKTSSTSKKTYSTRKTTTKVTTTMKAAAYNSSKPGAVVSWEWAIKNKVDDIRNSYGISDMVMAEELRNFAEEMATLYLTNKSAVISSKIEAYAKQKGWKLGFRAHKEYGINQSNGCDYLVGKITEDRDAKLYRDYAYHYIGIGVIHTKTSVGETLDAAVMIYRLGED